MPILHEKRSMADIINADEESFNNLLRIFNPESYGMTETMENDVLRYCISPWLFGFLY